MMHTILSIVFIVAVLFLPQMLRLFELLLIDVHRLGAKLHDLDIQIHLKGE